METWAAQKLFSVWKKLNSSSTNRKILGAAVTVASLTVLVKLVALVKELVVAWKFGTGDTLDAFLIAWLLPSFIINVVAVPFKAALIPTYIRVQEQEGSKAAQKLFSGTIVCGLGLLGITTVLMVLTAPLYLPWIASGFGLEKLTLTFHLLCAIAPIVLLSGIVNLLSAVLNSKERFALAALSPMMTPAISVVFLFTIKSWGIFALASGLVCGSVLEAALLGVALYRQGISLHLGWYGFDTHLRQVVSQYAPMIAGAFLMCSAVPVDQAMAAMLPPGSVAALNYGNRVTISLLSLIATALSTAVIPYFSKMAACEDWAGLRHAFNHYMQLIFIVSVPLTGILLVFSEPIVQIVFQRGSFTEKNSHLVAQIQALYALQIPFYLGDILGVGLIKSLNLSHILIWICLLNLFVNITLNYLFMSWIGVQGIALSTTCVYLFSFLCVFFFVKQSLKKVAV